MLRPKGLWPHAQNAMVSGHRPCRLDARSRVSLDERGKNPLDEQAGDEHHSTREPQLSHIGRIQGKRDSGGKPKSLLLLTWCRRGDSNPHGSPLLPGDWQLQSLMRPGDPYGGGRLGDFADQRLPGYCFFPTGEITISFFVLSTIAKSSFCSWSGTLNLSRTFLKSAPIACHSFSVMLRC